MQVQKKPRQLEQGNRETMKPATTSPYQHHQRRVVLASDGHDIIDHVKPVTKLYLQVKPIIKNNPGSGETLVETSNR